MLGDNILAVRIFKDDLFVMFDFMNRHVRLLSKLSILHVRRYKDENDQDGFLKLLTFTENGVLQCHLEKQRR
ncbi:unnamed protein product [Auanema sp. JU1783]|nr:unnamed protein product [Auanema sp. JU1783]